MDYSEFYVYYFTGESYYDSRGCLMNHQVNTIENIIICCALPTGGKWVL